MIKKTTFLFWIFSCLWTGLQAQAPSLSIAITSGSNEICDSTSVTFTATAQNAGEAPLIHWLINGDSTYTTGNTFTRNNLTNGAIVSAKLAAYITLDGTDTSWVPVYSNAIQMTVHPIVRPTASISIIEGSNPGCRDSVLTLEGASEGLDNPFYIWFVNGVVQDTNLRFSRRNLASGDVIACRVETSNAAVCQTASFAYADPIVISRVQTPQPPVISLVNNILYANYPNVQWYGPLGLIDSATGISYTPEEDGYYYATVINSYCESARSNTLHVTITTGINDLALGNGLKIFPNPASENIAVEWPDNSNAVISIKNIIGQTVYTAAVKNTNKSTVAVAALTKGVYFLTLQQDKSNTLSTSFIVK